MHECTAQKAELGVNDKNCIQKNWHKRVFCAVRGKNNKSFFLPKTEKKDIQKKMWSYDCKKSIYDIEPDCSIAVGDDEIVAF